MNHQSTLTSLAMLKVNVDRGKDYLEYLRPFILNVLSHNLPDVINDVTISGKLCDKFGLVIPHRTIQIMLRRLSKGGFLNKEHGIYKFVKSFEIEDFDVHKVKAARNITLVIESIIKYAVLTANRKITEDNAMEALLTFLSEFSIPCLKAYLRGTALPKVDKKGDWKIVLVSQYLRDIYKSDPVKFENFMLLVQGHMLANALLCPDLQSVSQTYKGVTFYFDTPLVLQILGLEGEAKKEAIDELIALVRKLSGKIAIFSHTRDELLNVIINSSDYIDSPNGRGSIVYEARKVGRTKSDMLLIAEQLTDILEFEDVHVSPTPPYTAEYQIDETVFSDVLSDEISYYNPKAMDNDINSVRSIYTLRKGTCPHMLEKCKAVFVTHNTAFARAAYEYGKNYEPSREISTVITSFSLANTAWLKAPQGAPLLPQKEVMAFAFAALRPSDAFLEKVLQEADKLEKVGRITARDHQLLRSSPQAITELMSLTLGEDEALNEESFTKTIDRVSAEIKKEEKEKLVEERDAHFRTQKKLSEEINQKKKIQERIYWKASRRAKFVSRMAVCIISFLVILGIAAGYNYRSNNQIIGWSLIIGSSTFVALTLMNLFLGITVRKLYKSTVKELHSIFFVQASKDLGLDRDTYMPSLDE